MSLVMYVKPGCPYCQAAREHLAAQGESVEERDATQNAAWSAEPMGYTHNQGVVPTIVRSDAATQRTSRSDSRPDGADGFIERPVAR